MARPSRRQRQQAQLTEDIVASAFAQLDEGGVPAVTWRMIAADVAMSPAALYTYFASFDELLTHLIADAYSEQASCVGVALGATADRSPTDQLGAGVHAYRCWALRRPQRFRLVYDEQIPGYRAPAAGPTRAAALRINLPLLAILADLVAAGWCDVLPQPAGMVDVADYRDQFGVDIDERVLWLGLSLWASYHGLVQLEVNGHLPPTVSDTDALFSDHLRLMFGMLGLDAPAADLAEIAGDAVATIVASHKPLVAGPLEQP